MADFFNKKQQQTQKRFPLVPVLIGSGALVIVAVLVTLIVVFAGKDRGTEVAADDSTESTFGSIGSDITEEEDTSYASAGAHYEEFNIGENNFNNGTEFIELNDSEEILEQTTISAFESKEEKFIQIPEEYNKEYEKDYVIKDNVVILLDDVNGIDEIDNKSNNSNKNNFENQNEMSENKSNDNSESSSNESGSVTEIVHINDSENTNSNNNNSEKDEEKEERENKEEQYDFNFLNRKRKFYGYDEDDDYNFFE